MANLAVKESNGFGVKVSDNEILSAQKELAHTTGLLVEPSSASTFAGYKKAKNNLRENEKVMLLMTGSGLKDSGALKLWNKEPQVKNAAEWKSLLIKGTS